MSSYWLFVIALMLLGISYILSNIGDELERIANSLNQEKEKKPEGE